MLIIQVFATGSHNRRLLGYGLRSLLSWNILLKRIKVSWHTQFSCQRFATFWSHLIKFLDIHIFLTFKIQLSMFLDILNSTDKVSWHSDFSYKRFLAFWIQLIKSFLTSSIRLSKFLDMQHSVVKSSWHVTFSCQNFLTCSIGLSKVLDM